MSMNLQLEGFELWQTPTYITNMCMSLDHQGEPDGGHDAVTKRYIFWVKQHTNGVWESDKEYEMVKENVTSHIKELLSWREKMSNCKYYIL